MEFTLDAALMDAMTVDIAQALERADIEFIKNNYPSFKMEFPSRTENRWLPHMSYSDMVKCALYDQVFGDRFEVLRHQSMECMHIGLGRQLREETGDVRFCPYSMYEERRDPMHDGIVFGGIRIVVSNLMPATLVAKRKLEKKKWMRKSQCYFARVTKKWCRRFGMIEQERVYMLGDHTLVMSRKMYEQFSAHVESNPATAYRELQSVIRGQRHA